MRFPVQYVIRPQSQEYHDYRGYAGRIAAGIIKPGATVTVYPTGKQSKVKTIDTLNEKLNLAFAPQSVTITLEDDIDISRGDLIVGNNSAPVSSQDVEIMICWFHERPLQVRGKYAVKHTTSDVRCLVQNVKFKMNINTLERNYDDKTVGLNDIARISIRTTKPIHYDSYRKNRITGSLILIDEATNQTVAAGMII